MLEGGDREQKIERERYREEREKRGGEREKKRKEKRWAETEKEICTKKRKSMCNIGNKEIEKRNLERKEKNKKRIAGG